MRAACVLVIAALAVASGSARSAEPPSGTPPPSEPSPGEKAQRGLELLMEAIEGWVRRLPSYAPPEVTPDGDIIIRRLDRDRPPSDGPPAPGQPGEKGL